MYIWHNSRESRPQIQKSMQTQANVLPTVQGSITCIPHQNNNEIRCALMRANTAPSGLLSQHNLTHWRALGPLRPALRAGCCGELQRLRGTKRLAETIRAGNRTKHLQCARRVTIPLDRNNRLCWRGINMDHTTGSAPGAPPITRARAHPGRRRRCWTSP